MDGVCIVACLEYLIFQTLWQDHPQFPPRLRWHSLPTQNALFVDTQSFFQVEILDDVGVMKLFSENSNFWPVFGFHKFVDLSEHLIVFLLLHELVRRELVC